MIKKGKMKYPFTALLYFFAVLLLISGCSSKPFSSSPAAGTVDESDAENVPYYANDFNDIMVPNELKWDREGSMAIRTESYAGGVLKFVGRVEVNSLSDFFVNTMTKNRWKLVGSAKYKNVLLAFTKPNKTAMVMIFESEISRKTTVHIYLTDDRVASAKAYNSFGEETVR